MRSFKSHNEKREFLKFWHIRDTLVWLLDLEIKKSKESESICRFLFAESRKLDTSESKRFYQIGWRRSYSKIAKLKIIKTFRIVKKWGLGRSIKLDFNSIEDGKEENLAGIKNKGVKIKKDEKPK